MQVIDASASVVFLWSSVIRQEPEPPYTAISLNVSHLINKFKEIRFLSFFCEINKDQTNFYDLRIFLIRILKAMPSYLIYTLFPCLKNYETGILINYYLFNWESKARVNACTWERITCMLKKIINLYRSVIVIEWRIFLFDITTNLSLKFLICCALLICCMVNIICTFCWCKFFANLLSGNSNQEWPP